MRQLPMSTGNADHAFPSNDPTFERGTVFNSSEQRLNAAIGKIDVEDESLLLRRDLEKQRDSQAGEQTLIFSSW